MSSFVSATDSGRGPAFALPGCDCATGAKRHPTPSSPVATANRTRPMFAPEKYYPADVSGSSICTSSPTT